MARRRVSNPLALAVLACLYEKPMHPYEIANTLRQRHKDESIKLNYGSLYSVVESLKSHALIVEQQTAREGNRPERTVYELTDAGRLELIDWLSELLSCPVKEFTQFEAGLSLLPVLQPKDVTSLLEERCKRLEVELEQYHSLRKLLSAQNVPRLFLVETEYRMALKAAELDFTRKLTQDIAAETLDGMVQWADFHQPK
jgi:DNA-binding PadR family transcriptional regulator